MAIRQRFIVLDGLRGVAALAVALRHLGELFHLPHLARHGYMAVDFFFILSGFVIVIAYERPLATTMTVPAFLRVRAVRLYPLIVLATVIGVLGTVGQHASGRRVVELALLGALALPFPSQAGLFPLNGPLWSMFYEVAGNVAYAVVRRLLSPRVLAVGLAVSALGVIAVAARIGDLDAGFTLRHGWAGAPRLAWPFLVGVALARLHMDGRLPRVSSPAWLLAAALCALLCLPQGSGPAWAALDVALSLVVLPAVLVLGVQARAGARTVWLCAIGGELSYPLYAVHKPIETATAAFISGQGLATRTALASAGLALALTCAFAASRAYDIPIRRWLSVRLLQGPRSGPPTGGALKTAAVSP